MSTLETGHVAEQKALTYLLAQGLTFVGQNYSCRLGEIDLIMREGAYLVFIEVRSRSHQGFGGGAASITYAKRQKIIKTTSHYLMKNKLYEQFPIRFDVISIDGSSGMITWLKDAFNADY
ncbi:YraN family protein [uncultured Legionella sp.]|uniref:YraN family protein n=1 Tax=uncultured Legionella sp. TaxID=210934 RepID=UPI0026203B69|nr:YraN family protein [uncultured Legionella sp.]